MEQQDTAVALQIEGLDRIVYAEPRPDDIERLKELLAGGPIAVELDESQDTEGHAGVQEVVLDVEGHAIALRLPTSADAAALRRGFALGAVTATLVISGAAAAVQGAELLNQPAGAQPAPAPAPAAQPANEGIDGPISPRIVRVE